MRNNLVDILDNLLTDEMINELAAFKKLSPDSECMMGCIMVLVKGDREFADFQK